MNSFSVRPANAGDIPFIYSTWLNSYKHDSAAGLSVTKTIFYEQYRLVLDHILASGDTVTLVACKSDEPNVIFGYVVADPTSAILHYAFVKESFQRLGIAKDLFARALPGCSAVVVSHLTNFANEIARRHSLTFNPFLLYSGNS